MAGLLLPELHREKVRLLHHEPQTNRPAGERRDIAVCYQNGANAYVIKPVGFPDFKTAVQSIGRFWSEINVPPPLKSRRLERRSWQI